MEAEGLVAGLRRPKGRSSMDSDERSAGSARAAQLGAFVARRFDRSRIFALPVRVQALAEVADPFAETASELGQPRCPEQDNDDQEDDDELGKS